MPSTPSGFRLHLHLQVGLFSATPEQKIYPNPAAAAAVPDAYALFEFLGKMLGKAMYEVGEPGCLGCSCAWWCMRRFLTLHLPSPFAG